MSEELYRLAVEGDLEGLCDAICEEEDDDGPDEAIYQWLVVSASLGNKLAAGMSEDIYEAALSRAGDETVAVLHYEVAEWFILGDNGVAADHGLGLEQLAVAQQFHLRESIDLGDDLQELRERLSEDHKRRFDGIFPPEGT